MSSQTRTSKPAMDPFERLQIIRNPDGSITRRLKVPSTSATPHTDHPSPLLTKDVPIDQSNNTWARIFLPRQALDDSCSPSSPTKLPLVVFFHGGGFILFSAASTIFHNFCSNMAVDLPTIVLSIDYRLAPEHRLPAAYDDAMDALRWIKTAQDDWLQTYADFSTCFLAGSSAGGNIAYHAGLRLADAVADLEPLKIRGLILLQPFFGGTQRTGSELRLVYDPLLPPFVSDLMWELSLPLGSDREHEYSNATVGTKSEDLEKIKGLGWRVLVTGCDGDPLIDRQMELVKMMEEKGLQVVGRFWVGDYHGVGIADPSKAKELFVFLKKFIFS